MVDNNQQQEKPQGFELIELLLGKVDSSTSNAVDQSFEARYQSLVDQIQSYLHSSEKPGFFPHRFLGSFSSVLDTKLNDKLGIKKLHFRFEGARTLKVVAETESKIHVFIFTEDIEAQHSKQTNTKNFEFTTGEWKNVMGRDYTKSDAHKLQIDVIKILKDKYELVKSKPKSDKDVKSKKLYLYLKRDGVLEYKAKNVYGNVKTIEVSRDQLKGKVFDEVKQFLGKQGKDLSDDARKELSRITSAKGYTLKSDGEDEKINIKVESKKKIVDQPIEPIVKFQEVTKKLGKSIYLEDYIEKLVSSDTRQAKENLKAILNYIKKIHTNLDLQANVYGIKAREADQHGFVAGIFDNFRYRDNTKLYLEQFAGGGYADIVLLVRGPNRAVDSVPILIELKAGTEGQIDPSDALEQAKDYIKGFRANKMRILTNADNAIAVGLNLDDAEPFKTEVQPIKQPPAPLMEEFVKLAQRWNNQQISEEDFKQEIAGLLSSEYHTFPANKETKDHYYFSRDMLGQSILINKIGQDRGNVKKYIYSYDEYPLEWSRGTEYTLSKSPVMTLIFVQGNEGQEKTAFIFHIRESNTKEFYANKKIPVLDIPGIGIVGNVIEIKMSLKKHETGSNFEELFEIKQISNYSPSGTVQQFRGSFLEIPHADELRAKLDQAITSQHASDGEGSLQAYKVLLTEVADTIYPIKDLITNEARLQAVLNGLLSSYSDLKLKETSTKQQDSAKTVIIPEFQVGAGGRVDMVIQGIGPSPQGTKEYTPIALEFKLIDKNLDEEGMKKEVDKLTKEQNVRYAKGAALKAITDSDKMFFMGVVVNMKAKDKNSLILTSDEFVSAIVVHSSIDIAKRKHLEEIQEVTQRLKNIGIQEENLRTLESATAEKDYHYWLQQHDIADIARIKYDYGIDTLFEIVGSPEHIVNQLQQFQNSVRGGEKRPLTLIVNLNNNHWVTLVISHQNGQYNGYYVDSLGSNVPDNIRQVLQKVQITVHDVSVIQQRDGYNCGLWALENARDINTVLQGNRLSNIPDEIRNHLRIQRRENHFIRMREGISNTLSIDPQRIANLEAVLAGTQQPKFDLNSCVGGGRSRRSINPCLFSKGDVEKFSKGKVDENNADKIIIDSEKFLTYVKSSQDEAKNAQLIEFVGDKSIEGDHKYLLDKVTEDQGYERYIQNERVKNLHGDISQQASSATKGSKLKGRLMNAAGGIQLIRGIHGAIVSCKEGTATDCGLNLGGIGWSFASQPIENVMVKITPKVVASAEKVVGKIIPGTLGKQTKFAIRVVGVKFGSTIARGTAGAVTGVFDIVDIGMSVNNLVDCKKRENSDNPCGEKEIRDNIATISFSTISFVSGVALTALGMPGIGIAVGVALMVASGVYSGVSNIVEYEKKYDTTHDENWRIFWHTFAFQPVPQDVQHLAARKEMVNSLAKGVWKALNNDPSNVVAYSIGLGKINGNTLRPDYATIMMNRTNANTKNLSRVVPDYIKGADRICLPQITNQDYEKGIKSSVKSAVYYCENAMIIDHGGRVKMKQKDKTIVYDLQNVDRGTIAGSNVWNNNFLIYSGTAGITGGNNVANRFVLVNNPSFSGKIIGGSNSTNILDLSQLTKEKVIGVNVDYRFKPSAYGRLKVKINSRLLIDDYVSNNLFNYHYVGRKDKVDKILCMGYSEHFTGTDDRDVIIDSGGGSNNNEKDVVESCKKVIISPYTRVKGRKSNYTFYVKTADYKGRGLYSEIDVDGTGTVSFPEFDLLSDCDQITYSKNSNTLSLKINFGQNNQFTLDIKNYVERSSNKPYFVLIDKNGSNIVPKIERSDSSTIKITSFELHSEHSLKGFRAVENHYKKILNNHKGYKVLSVVRGKTQSQNNSVVSHMVFGSSGDDIINFDQGTMFARGGGGSDVYFISNDINSREVKIDNNSSDKKLDTLFMSAVEKDFSIQQCDLYLKYNNSNIRVKNYFQDPNYRHLIIMNKKGETFIPNIQSMSCSPFSSGKDKLVPFLQATQTQNMFLLPKDFEDDHVVIDSRLEDIEKYKDKDDLLLIRESENPFIIRIEGFYTDRSKWENISYSLWNNNDLFLSSGLLENVDNVVEYKDKLRGDYERIVKEYIEDFSDSTSIIQHNQKLEKNISTSVGQDEERIGVMVLKNITPDQVEVSSSGTDLIFRDKKSNHTININNWNNSESYRISTLEFDLGLEPITIRKLDRFSLPEVRKIQALIDKASENYQNRSKYTPKVENDFKCLISVDDFERENRDPVHQCLGFPSLQDRVSFTESSCSLEQIEELKNKTPSSNQILTLLEKLENNLLLNGYDSNIIDQCNKWMITSGLGVLKPLVSTAIYEGKWDEVKTLLDKTARKSKADVEYKNQCSKNWTTLNHAVYNGNVKLSESIFKSFLEKKGDINALTSCNNDNWALLHYAVHYSNFDMVSFLVDKGANIEIRSKEGQTPLHLAVEEAKQNIINLLLDRGADIEAKNNDGRTPLYLAAYNNDSGVIELLCNRIKTKSNDASKMIKQVGFLKKEVVNQANIPSNAKRLVESCISSLRDSIKSAAKKVLKEGILHSRSASTIELIDKVYNFDERLFNEAIKEAVNDTYAGVGIEGILRFIRSHHYIGQFIPGYIAAFDKIPKNDGAMFKLAYSIRETMKMPRVNSEEKSDLERLKNKLPESVRNAVFSSEVCIKNVEYGRYLYSPNNDCMYHLNNCDRDRRYVFTWPSNGNGDQFKWKVELNGDNVYLKNVEYGRYLYSPNDDCTYHLNDCDRGRRYAFTWPSNSNSDKFKWKVEPNGDNVYLKNVEYGRYLYSPNSASTFQVDNNRRYVFTWPSNEEGGQFKWKIENCGSTRKRRSIRELNGYNQTAVDYQLILTEENSQQIASRISAIVEDVERHTFLNQSKNKLYLDSYLNNRGRSNAADSMRRDVCNELNASERRNIVLSGNDVCAITSGYETLDIENFPIQEVVINDDVNGKKSLRSTLDLHQLVQQINRDLSIKPIPTVIKGKSDLLIKLSISATGLQQDVITVRLKDALVNKWYKKLQIIFDNAPMEIDDSLGLKSSFFISDEKIIVVTPQDVEEKNKLIISKKAGQYTYLHDKYDLIVTNAFNADIEASELCIIHFKDFYKELKMETLSIKFADKEILLSNEIDKIRNSDSIDELNNVSSIINSQKNSIPLEAPNSGDINAQGKLGRTSLHLASGAGEWDKAKLLLDRGANTEIQDEFGYTPIFLATQSGKCSIVKLLLDRGANIDAQDKEGKTLLHFAASGNNLDMVQFLLDRGASIEVQDGRDWTPILYAAQSGKWGVVKLLVSNGAKFNNEITYQGTPLHFAAQEGNLDIAQFLLDEGADIESQDDHNRKPLHLAVEAGRLNVVKLLLDRGASVNAKDENNKTPLDLATKGDMIEILKKAELDQGLLINARDGNLDKVKDLIAQGANLEAKDNNDNTPLHNACNNGHFNVAKYLIEKGASLKAKNKDNKTPLELVEQKGYTDIVEILKQTQLNLDRELLIAVEKEDLGKVRDNIRRGANVNAQSRLGWVSVFWAIQKDNLNIVKLLINNGADINAKDNESWMPLHWAVQLGSLDVVKYLVERGANINALTADGRTPLDLAAQKNRVNVIEFLKKAQLDLDKELLTAVQDGDLNKVEGLANQGAGLNTKGSNDWTLLHFAVFSNKFDIVKFLLDKNANIKAKDVYGNTPLHVAAQYDSKLEIVEFLLDRNASGINDVNNNGSTPLHLAIQGNKPSTVKLLLNKGANINAKDKDGKTPLDLAVQEGYTDIIQIIEQVQSDLDKELLTAVQNGDLNKVKSLISRNANVNTRDKYSWTPLHWAAYKGHLEVAEFLVKKGADINAADKGPYGKKSIHVAAENNSKDIIEFFLSKGVSINDTDKQGYTPLHYAAWRGRLEVAKFLIEEYANSIFKYNNGSTLPCNASLGNHLDIIKCSMGEKNILEIRDNSGRVPLHCAASNGKLDIVKYFIDEEKVDVNVKDNNDDTPLHLATGYLDVVKYLISKGANINAKCKAGKTPLDIAAYQKLSDVVEYLKQTQLDLDKKLLIAAKGGDLNKAIDLISKGANVNVKDNNDDTPLHLAVGYLDVVKYLISKGANINAKCKAGATPLDIAAYQKLSDVVEYLKQTQLDLDKKLLIAVKSGGLNKIIDLFNRGANINAENEYGKNPIHIAAESDYKNIIEFLLSKEGVGVNDTDEQGHTPLHWASWSGHLGMLEYLIGKGANINAKCKAGKTTLDIARDKGYNNIVEYLEGKLKEEREKPAQRKRRHHHGDHDHHRSHLSRNLLAIDSSGQPEIAASSSTRPSSWINDLFSWVKSSVGGFRAALPEETLSTTSSISQVDAPIDVNGTIMLLDLLIRKVTGQKYIFTVDQSISPLEAQGYALNIKKGFRKVVEQAARDSKISIHRLDIDFIKVQEEITRKVMDGKFNEISGILNSHLEKACPGREAGCPGKLSPKKFEKFAQFNKGLLNQSIEQILHNRDSTLEVDGTKKQQMSLEPQSYLSNASVHSHSEVSTCLSEIGVTKLGGNLNR
ncbi:ankyrin repeat domain-containing protein [Wolbachia endosymbiont (group B) of Idaea aversata]|uniref:ankyrin repeat domain-containing protein n=1 Tax=Wolbachia endosymbiont (group B) of Idaea aversata TaxID=2954020 RepID=UPI00221FCF7D|nr:ankyrin repeat domain-containing protein [Wolbachia endosymbiont (group B) of Idaea aversata]